VGRRAQATARRGGRLSLCRPVVLIGLPGAGKSTVAPRAADLLGSPWCDLDQRIVARTGRSIAETFASDGEARFRALERATMLDLLAEPAQIIATGGGWAAEPGNIATISGRALLIYLSLTPAEAVARLAGSSGRPLLATGSPVLRMTELLTARESWYHLAEIEIAVGAAAPDAVASSIAIAARQYGGW
jgi:shikimate kinase